MTAPRPLVELPRRIIEALEARALGPRGLGALDVDEVLELLPRAGVGPHDVLGALGLLEEAALVERDLVSERHLARKGYGKLRRYRLSRSPAHDEELLALGRRLEHGS